MPLPSIPFPTCCLRSAIWRQRAEFFRTRMEYRDLRATIPISDGWFGGNISVSGDEVTVEPKDASRTRFYLAPAGLWLTLDSGQFERLVWNEKSGKLRIALAPKDGFTPQARIRIEQTAHLAGAVSFHVNGSPALERGAYVIPLSSSQTWVELAR